MGEGEGEKSGGRSVALWILAGCGGCLLLVAGAVALVLGFGLYAVRSVREDNADPDARASAAREILGARSLPSGYFVNGVGSAPLGLFRMVVLSDQPSEDEASGPVEALPPEAPPAEQGSEAPDSRGAPVQWKTKPKRFFLYLDAVRGPAPFHSTDVATSDESIRDLLEHGNVHIREGGRGEALGRGTVEAAGARIAWIAERGSLESDQTGSMEGLTTLLVIDCPNDQRMRLAVWTVEDPAPDSPASQLDLAGTSADPQAIRAMLADFQFCGS